MTDDRQVRVRDHSFDGIEELDNPLPNWWLWILYGSIVFSIVYWLLYHTLGVAPLPEESYRAEMQAAAEAQLARAAAGGVTNASLTLMSQMEDQVEQGRQLFQTYCVVCHANQGQGLVGPNLTDAYWLNGGTPLDILNTVTLGVPSKGMAAWGRQLGPQRVEQAVAFVLSIRDTNVPGKESQGELYVPEEDAGGEDAATTGEDAPATGDEGSGTDEVAGAEPAE